MDHLATPHRTHPPDAAARGGNLRLQPAPDLPIITAEVIERAQREAYRLRAEAVGAFFAAAADRARSGGRQLASWLGRIRAWQTPAAQPRP